MTVAEMHQRMTNAEYVDWTIYYGRKAQRDEMAMASAKKGKK